MSKKNYDDDYVSIFDTEEEFEDEDEEDEDDEELFEDYGAPDMGDFEDDDYDEADEEDEDEEDLMDDGFYYDDEASDDTEDF